MSRSDVSVICVLEMRRVLGRQLIEGPWRILAASLRERVISESRFSLEHSVGSAPWTAVSAIEKRLLWCGAKHTARISSDPSVFAFRSARLADGPSRGWMQNVRWLARNRPVQQEKISPNEPDPSASRTAVTEEDTKANSLPSEAEDITTPSQTTASRSQVAKLPSPI